MNSKRSRSLIVLGALAIVAAAGLIALRGRTPPPESTATKPPPPAAVPAASVPVRRPLDDAFKAAMEHDSRAAAGRPAAVPDASP